MTKQPNLLLAPMHQFALRVEAQPNLAAGTNLPSVLGDDTRLFSSGNRMNPEESGALKDGQRIFDRFNCPDVLKNDDVEQGFTDGQGANGRFNFLEGVAVAANCDISVADSEDHAIRVITPQGAVRTLCDNGQAGFTDAQGAGARFNDPRGLALDTEENLLVADYGNHTIRSVTMAGAVSTVAGNGEKGFADGAGAAARFNRPYDLVVDGEGGIVVADRDNHRLRKIVGGQVTTLACARVGRRVL